MTDLLVFPLPDNSARFESRTVDGENFLTIACKGRVTATPYDRQALVVLARAQGLVVEFDWGHVVRVITREEQSTDHIDWDALAEKRLGQS